LPTQTVYVEDTERRGYRGHRAHRDEKENQERCDRTFGFIFFSPQRSLRA
jgi:hypothetical protein